MAANSVACYEFESYRLNTFYVFIFFLFTAEANERVVQVAFAIGRRGLGYSLVGRP